MRRTKKGVWGRTAPAAHDGSPAVVALRMEDITHWTIERVAKMPRAHKFAIGDKRVDARLDVTCALVEATYALSSLSPARAPGARPS